ncbi:zinc finger protein ZAT8-like [Miscanthus floridulus]|uniref:zinc finger protein ZAT8-like n=1 Tax=Miscanthus floridulus TaxID=154761 RepID=UPI00345A2920
MKRPRTEQEPAGEVSLALSLSTTESSTTSDSTGTPSSSAKRARRRGAVVATSGEGEFVCKTCSRAFTSFQALGGHRTSHLRGRHGLELGVGARALKQAAAAANGGSGGDKPPQQQQHECHICGLGFEMGQALGGHMRRHREEMGAADAWVWRTEAPRATAIDPPVLLELFT